MRDSVRCPADTCPASVLPARAVQRALEIRQLLLMATHRGAATITPIVGLSLESVQDWAPEKMGVISAPTKSALLVADRVYYHFSDSPFPNSG